MYCVIQKVFNKKCNSLGESKKIEVTEYNWGIGDNKPNIHYGYKCTGHFVRNHREAFKISIHKSYRENGKIKKKQWVLCTMGYYDLLDWSLYDCAGGKIDKVSEETGVSADDIYNIVYKKLDPIISKITEEYEQTEEYKTKVKNNKILSKYFTAKGKFEAKYGQDTYDYCYDVFGVLRTEEYLNQLYKEYKTKQEYYSSYYENFKSNYKSNSDSSYFDIGHSTYTKDEKVKLKKIYKVLALKFHPDINNGDADMMKFINRLKEQWGI
ncbi:hypothetical protein [Clostridium tyrobutyricum]|uniref:hypothetical protein n=1 Tax=Clostridium tyrobutyricum TaxID=1519 RepID=UPI001C389AD9|nr:hypothetical protein [Clostridium tyrobutyricum]MBV4417060.1 hypothetical protein [Clostridium tyrobutyricum]